MSYIDDPTITGIKLKSNSEYEAAAECFKKGIELSNDPVASFHLAEMYFHGMGVPQDITKAISLYAKAVPTIPEAACSLAFIYENEHAPMIDSACLIRAYNLYLKAAKGGSEYAIKKMEEYIELPHIGVAGISEKGVVKRYDHSSVMEIISSSRKGDIDSLEVLGDLYLNEIIISPHNRRNHLKVLQYLSALKNRQ